MTACIALLGGSFDPVHNGHIALAAHFVQLLHADRLRVIPTLPWQKSALVATPEQRAEMARLAFAGQPFAAEIDRQEIERNKPTYTVDTLRALRAELGEATSLCFLMGADQLERFDTWHDWQSLFGLANFCVAARPGFTLDGPQVPRAVAAEFRQRLAPPHTVRATPAGLACLAPDLAVDISATRIRAALQQGGEANSLVPQVVLDYIEQHNLYKN
ncbi:nicotinate-nucleotide adenylyltransferase [Massilia endophytica]|uniref:nicotinate-nucleotide adenylyltransferase n=1 Tax=Massilia endophytica TaxID=2899220 RepID=UPI001E4E4D40|nr:nicotinate-nucleotide adenylyltransferase [Massilia endophytica]UGQ45452.1 nicotinate-nucleotide adenylyltransferase [Massilia endophytica]